MQQDVYLAFFKLFKSLEAYLDVENHSYFKSCRHKKYVVCNARRDSQKQIVYLPKLGCCGLSQNN